ncbi:MAG: DMT family transporter [Nitratireductor sp.]|nr:DMT family transporter [Nitratireductor sp.]MCB1455253.1 DMT family transporter [Nitratireductor sp.]
MNPFIAPAALLLSGIVWGTTIPLGKIAVSTGHHPLGLIFWQVVIVALALLPVVVRRGVWPGFDRFALRHYLVIALLGTILPNSISYVVAARLPAGILSIVISAIPMFSTAIALAIGSERFSLSRTAGIALGLVAVLLLTAPKASLPDPSLAIFVLLGLLPPLLYAMEGNYVASFAPRAIDPVTSLFGASVLSALIAAPMALLAGGFIDPFTRWQEAEWALVGSSLGHVVAYTGYIWLLGVAGAMFTSQVSYIVTFSGVASSAFFLSERYSWTVWLALGLMIAGMMLVKPKKAADQAPAGA